MTIRANYDPKFFRRFLWIGLGCIAFTGWCFYDALLKYPHELERATVYWQSSAGSMELTGMDREEWRTAVREKGWSSVEPPDKPEELHHKIQSQYMYATVCSVIGMVCLLKWLLAKGSWVEADQKELKSNFGPTFQFDQIKNIDKAKWEKKGITKIHYEVGGKTKSFAFDDFKYSREPMGKILRMIEGTLTDEQITGGPRESEPAKTTLD